MIAPLQLHDRLSADSKGKFCSLSTGGGGAVRQPKLEVLGVAFFLGRLMGGSPLLTGFFEGTLPSWKSPPVLARGSDEDSEDIAGRSVPIKPVRAAAKSRTISVGSSSTKMASSSAEFLRVSR